MKPLRSNVTRLTTLAVGLAIFTALSYLLIALNIQGVGDPQAARDGGPIIYLIGKQMIQVRPILLRDIMVLRQSARLRHLAARRITCRTSPEPLSGAGRFRLTIRCA